jgi:hypothetical protein
MSITPNKGTQTLRTVFLHAAKTKMFKTNSNAKIVRLPIAASTKRNAPGKDGLKSERSSKQIQAPAPSQIASRSKIMFTQCFNLGVCNLTLYVRIIPNGDVSDGGGKRAPESANRHRPPQFAPRKS